MYDANGNPTKYYNGGTMTWRNGRQLASYSLGGKTYRYEYFVGFPLASYVIAFPSKAVSRSFQLLSP